MVPISLDNHATPTLPPPPSFADFKFTVIGQPQLLKRLTTPVPEFRPSPTPAHMELQYPSRATTPSSPPAPHRPSLLQRLESVDHTTVPLFRDMLIPQNPEDQMTVDQKPVIRNVALAPLPDSDLTYGAENAEDNLCPSIRSPKTPLVIDPHNDTVSKPAASDPAMSTSLRATTVVQHESSPTLVLTLPPPCAATPPPLSTHRGEEDSVPVHPAPSQQVLQIQYSLALSYESALLAFEKAEHVLTLARENYEAAKASLAAAAKAQTHFQAAVSPAHDERVGGVGKLVVVPDGSEGELDSRTTKDGGVHALAASSRYPTSKRVTQASASPALAAVLTRSMNRRVIELEREANDARLAWSLESVERPKSDPGARAQARRADGYVGLAEEDEAPEPESRPRRINYDGVRASQSASASQVSTHVSTTPVPFLSNPLTGLEVPQADPQQLRTQELTLSSVSSLPQTATARHPSSQPTFQTCPLGTSQTIHHRDMLLNTDTDQDDTRTGHTAPIPTPPITPSNAPQLSTVWAICRTGAHIATAPRPPDSQIATISQDEAPQDVSPSDSTLPSTPLEAMVDELLDDHDDDDGSRNLKLELESDADSGTVVGVEMKPLHHRAGGRLSVRQDKDDEVDVEVENDECWKAGSGQERSASLSLQVSRRSSVGPEVKGIVVGEDFAVSSARLSARGNRSPSFRHVVDSEIPLVDTQEVVDDQKTSLTLGDAPGTSLPKHRHQLDTGEREGEVDANDGVGNMRSGKSFEEFHAEEPPRNYDPALANALPLQHNNIREASDGPFPSPGTLLQRLQPPLEEPLRSNTTPAISEAPVDPPQTPSPVGLGKRRHVDDHSMTPPNPGVPPPKRRLSANSYNSPPPLRSQNHPISPIKPRIGDAPAHAHRNAEGYNRPPSAPRRMYQQSYDIGYSHTPHSHDRYVPRNTHWPHGARGRSVSPLDRPREHGDGHGVRLGAHRLVGARSRNSYRPRGTEPLRDRGGPPLPLPPSQRWAEKDPVPAVEKNGHGYGHGGMSLADRLRDP